MGLFDFIREIGDNIYAEVALATAEPASEETMREVYDYWGLDEEYQEPFRVIKCDLNYGHDNAMKVIKLAGDFINIVQKVSHMKRLLKFYKCR